MTALALRRLPDWETRLHDFLVGKAGVMFTWGATDCCMFSADAVLAITGVDPVAEFRGRYTTPGGAARALKRYGAGTLEATIGAKFPVVGCAFARRGDLVRVDEAIGVCIGAHAVLVGDERRDGIDTPGLMTFARERWSTCWSVG